MDHESDFSADCSHKGEGIKCFCVIIVTGYGCYGSGMGCAKPIQNKAKKEVSKPNQ